MNMIVSKKNTIFFVVAFCILSSPGLSYSILYPYHLILPFILLIIFNDFSKKNFIANKFSVYLILFFSYCCFSAIFLKSYILFFKYISYIFISFSCMIYIYNYMNSRGYSLVVKVFSIYIAFMITVAFLESAGLIRLPFSPYSPYYGMFGKSIDVSEWSDDVFTYNTQKPTVFSSNPNTFGFILICYFPFLFLLKNKILKTLLFFLSFFILYKIDSKMILITFIIFLFFKYLFFSNKKVIFFIVLLFLIVLLYPILTALQSSGLLDSRMFSAIDELIKGFDYLTGKSVANEMDSTGERAYIYSIGIEKLKDTYGIGMGWSGIESYLMDFFGKHTAFHNFFLMMLVDLGIFGFLLVVFFYFYIIKNLYLGFKMYRGENIGKVYEAFLLGMILSVFASITPSGIIYLLPYWFFVGAASFMAFNYKRIIDRI